MATSASFPVAQPAVPGGSVAVDVYVKDDSVSGNPIEGVVVGVYNPSTLNAVASAETDAQGRAALILPASASPGTSYEIRLYKLGVLFKNTRLIAVIDPLGAGQTNIFDVSGTLTTTPVATDPRCCRCTGRFMDFSNHPSAGALLRVVNKVNDPTPKMVDGNLVSVQEMTFKTDQNGYVSFDLIRGGSYLIMFAGEEDVLWEILVPDRSSANLIDLMFPGPAAVTWDSTAAPGNVVSLVVGEILEVPFTVLLSNYEVREDKLGSWVDILIGDSSVVAASINGGSLFITGLAAGSTTARPEPYAGLKPDRVPDATVSATPLAITVTE